jgi:hypothetical protein
MSSGINEEIVWLDITVDQLFIAERDSPMNNIPLMEIL